MNHASRWIALCIAAAVSACGGGGGGGGDAAVERGAPISRGEQTPLPTGDEARARPGAISSAAALRADLEAFRVRNELSGVSLVIVDRDRIESVVAGLRQVEKPDPIQTTDKFYIGSLTKAITATLVGKFVEAGKLRYDSTLGELLPDLKAQMHPHWHTATIDQSLRHQSGMKNAPDMIDVEYLLPRLTANPSENTALAVRRTLSQPPEFTDGKFHYSSLDIMTVGMVLERLSGSSYENLLQTQLLAPLGIEATLGYKPVTGNEVSGHWKPLGGTMWYSKDEPDLDRKWIDISYAAGALHLSMANYGLYLRDQLRGLNGRPALLSKQSYVAAFTPVEGQGYGWNIITDPKLGKFGTHGGAITTYLSYSIVVPEHDIAVAIVCNCRPYWPTALEMYASSLVDQLRATR